MNCRRCDSAILRPRRGQYYCSPSCRKSHWEARNPRGRHARLKALCEMVEGVTVQAFDTLDDLREAILRVVKEAQHAL
jgi:hypothetical protein